MIHLHRECHVPSGNFDLLTINETAKALITASHSSLPFVGSLLSALVGLFWPGSVENKWDEFKAEMERIMDEKIKPAVYGPIEQVLVSIGELLKQYISAHHSGGNKEHLRNTFTAAELHFVNSASLFQNPKNEWVLGSLFGIFANLHITLLSDCVFHSGPHGENWGWEQSAYDEYRAHYKNRLAEYLQYMSKVRKNRKAVLAIYAPTNLDKHRTNIYNYWQEYHEQSITLIEDYEITLQRGWFGPEFPDIYSRAYGTADDWDATVQKFGDAPRPFYHNPSISFEDIYVADYRYPGIQRARVVDVTYPGGKGPRTTGVSGEEQVDFYGIIANPETGMYPRHISFPDPRLEKKMFNVEKAQIWAEDVIDRVQLILDDGTVKELWRTDHGSHAEVVVSGRKLTTLNMWTRSRYHESVLGCIIFGFSRDTDYIPPHVHRLHYIAAIQEPNINGIDAEWEAARKDWWAHLETNYSKK